MKPLSQGIGDLPYDEFPIAVIKYNLRSGEIFYANPKARKLLELPKNPRKPVDIRMVRGMESRKFEKGDNGFRVYNNFPHATAKGKQIVLKVLRKSVRSKNVRFNLEFLEEVVDASGVKDTIIQNSIDAFVSIDTREVIQDWNPAAERIFGWKKSEAVGRTLRELIIPKRYQVRHQRGLKSYLKSGKSTMLNRLIEIHAVDKSGREFPIELTVSPASQNGTTLFYSYIRDISDRKAIEDRLRMQEYNLKKAQSIAAIGSWQIIGDKDEVYWSDEFFKIHGLDPQSVKPSTKLRLSMVHPEDRKKLQVAIEEAASYGKPYALEKRILRPDGSMRWVLSQGEATVDSVTGTWRVLGTLLDITDRKVIEEKQRTANQSLADFENAIRGSSIVSRADRNGTITYVNDNFVKISGYSASELIGNNHRVINSGHHPKSFWVSMWKTIASGKAWRADVKNRSKNGSYYWVDTFIMPFLDSKGKVKEFLSIRNDITQRKAQEESIRHLNRSLADFHYAIEKSSIVSRTDKRGIITYVNKNFLDISGYEQRELIGKTHNIINSSYHPRAFWVDMWKTISSGKTWRAEVKNKAKDGTYYWVDTFIMPFLDENKNVKEFLSIRNDITRRKRSEEDLAKSNSRLSETLIFGKMGSAELNMATYALTVSVELLKLLDIVSETPRQIELQEFLTTYIHPDFLSRVYGKISEGSTGKVDVDTIVEVEFDMVTALGRRISIEAKGIFNGRTALGILHDVTDKKRTNQELLIKSNTINRMLQGITDGFFATDRQLNFTLVSPVFAALAKTKADAMEGKNMLDLFPQMRDSQLPSIYLSAIHSGKSVSIEHANLYDRSQIFQINIYPFSEGLFVYYKDISDAKKAEEALRDTNELFRRLSDNVPGMIYNFYLTSKEEPTFPFVSNGCEQLLGLSAEKLVNDPASFFKMIHPADRKGVSTSIREAFHANTPWSAEFRIVVDDDTIKWVSAASNPYREKNGENYWYGYMSDITEEKSAAVQIERSEHDLRAVLNASNDASFFLDKNRKVRLANFAAVTSIKEIYSRDFELGQDLLEFVPESSREKFDHYFQEALNGHPIETEKEITFNAHYRIWLRLNYLPVRDRFDSVIGVSFNAANITGRKIAELSLKESEERFKQLYNNTPAMMQSVDAEGRIKRVNDYWLQKMGYSREEVIGARASQFMTERTITREAESYRPLFVKTGQLTNAEYDFVTRDGSIMNTLLSAISMSNSEGMGEKSINVITDVTENKKLQEEVEKLAKIASRTSNSVIFTDANGRITWVNEGFERITEYKLDEVVGRKPGDFLQGEETDRPTISRMRSGLQEKTGFKVELLNYSKSGRAYWIDIETLPVTNENKEVIGYMAIQSEITSLKNAIREMQRSEQTLQSFMDHAPMVAFAKDLKGRYTFYNKTYRDFMSHMELKPGFTDYDIFDKEFSDLCVTRDKHIERTGEVLQFEHDVQDKKFLEYKFPLKDSFDKIFAIGGISIDITEKLEAQRIVAENEENLRSLTDSLPMGVLFRYSVNGQGDFNFSYVSSGAKNLYGFSPEEIKHDPQSVFNQVDPAYLPRMMELGEQSRIALSNFEFEYPIMLSSGVVKWVQTRSKPKRLEDGSTEWGGITLDITQLKTAEGKLQGVYDELNAVLNASNDSSYFLDPSYRIRVFNKTGETQIRAAFNTQVEKGESILKYIPAETTEDFKRNFARALSGEPVTIERPVGFGTVAQRWIQFRYLPVFSKGEIIGVSFTANDIHSRKLAEQELFRNRKYFESLVNSQSSYLIRLDVQGAFTFMNERFATVFNNSHADLSLAVLNTIHQTHQRYFHETIRQCVENPGRVFPITLRQSSANGVNELWTEWEFVGLHDEEDVVIGIQAVGFDATYRVSYQKELERVNSRLMLATHAAKMGIWEWDLQANEISWDNWYSIVHGLPGNAPQHLDTVTKIMYPDDMVSIRRQIDLLTPEESEFSATFRIKRPSDGKTRFIKFFAAATFDDQGQKQIITGVNYDITEQQVAIAALAESEERFRTLVRDINIGILLQGPDSQITLSNQAALNLLGVSEDKLLGRDSFSPEWNIIHEDGSPFEADALPVPVAMKTKNAVRGVIMGVQRPKTNDRVWLMVDAIPRIDAHGKIENVICTFNDISELKTVEKRMHETRERLKVITDNLPSVAIYQYETKPGMRDGVYKYYSSGVEALTGLSSDDLLANPTLFENQIHHDDFSFKQVKIDEANQFLSVFDHEYRFKHRQTNAWRWLTTRSQPTKMNDGRVVWNGLIIDRTDQRKAEDDLLKSLKEKDILIKEIHHRVKNNLQLISSILYIKMMGITESEMKNFLEDTRQKIRSIALIHERLLQTESVNQVDVSDYLSKLVKDLRMSNSRPNLDLQVEEQIDPDNMNLDTAIFCGLIINELFTNAVKHAFKDSDQGFIKIGLRTISGYKVLNFSDNGTSLPDYIVPGQTGSFGMKMLEIFVKQLNGDLRIERSSGTMFEIRFK